MKIFVCNIHSEISEQELRAAFSAFGHVQACRLVRDRITHESRGYAFVEMPSDRHAQLAIKTLNKTKVLGRRIAVMQCKQPDIYRAEQAARRAAASESSSLVFSEQRPDRWKMSAVSRVDRDERA